MIRTVRVAAATYLKAVHRTSLMYGTALTHAVLRKGCSVCGWCGYMCHKHEDCAYRSLEQELRESFRSPEARSGKMTEMIDHYMEVRYA